MKNPFLGDALSSTAGEISACSESELTLGASVSVRNLRLEFLRLGSGTFLRGNNTATVVVVEVVLKGAGVVSSSNSGGFSVFASLVVNAVVVG